MIYAMACYEEGKWEEKIKSYAALCKIWEVRTMQDFLYYWKKYVLFSKSAKEKGTKEKLHCMYIPPEHRMLEKETLNKWCYILIKQVSMLLFSVKQKFTVCSTHCSSTQVENISYENNFSYSISINFCQ